MKKARKPKSALARRPSPLAAGHEAQQPPAEFISEMVALLNAGRLEQLEQMASLAIHRWPDHFIGWKARGIFLLMRGRAAEALEPLRHTVKLAGADAQAHQNLGSALLELGRFEEAEASYRQALAINPEYVQAHNNLGITLMNLGRFSEAETHYRQALAIKPDFSEAHNNLANTLKELGRFPEAEACCRQALTGNPGWAHAHQNLGNILVELGRLDEAEASYRQALMRKPDYAQAHSGLGLIHLKRGKLAEAMASYRQALALDRRLLEAHDGLNHALSRLTPMWHVPMMNDRLRNDAYFTALSAAVTPDMHVLEIGTGSGLLAMMAARLGARQVTTCEAVAEIAQTAQAIVADNGFAQRVTVIPKVSTKLQIGVDLNDRADLLVSEILSSEFLGEGVLSSIEDARQRLLKPGARIIPARGSIQFALFGGEDIRHNIRVDQVYGFDLSRFNALVPAKQYLSRNDLNLEFLTDAASAFCFDFMAAKPFPLSDRQHLEVPITKAGRCCGIIQWLRLEMDDTVVFENHPAVKNPASSWQHCVYALPTPIDVMPGQVAVIRVAHNRHTPWFFFEGLK